MGDVIEHLVDPWSMLKKITRFLSSDGYLIASIPNINHWRVIADLILFDKWEYQKAGILDKGHLRFFTQKTIMAMFNQSGYTVKSIRAVRSERTGPKLLNLLSFGLFKKFLTWHYLIKARKTG